MKEIKKEKVDIELCILVESDTVFLLLTAVFVSLKTWQHKDVNFTQLALSTQYRPVFVETVD